MHELLPAYFEWWHLPIIFLSGLIGEAYGVIVGSGGITTLFALTAFGVPLPNIIALDVAGAIGTDTGILVASRKELRTHKKLIATLALPIFLGGALGILFLVNIPAIWLQRIIVISLIAILIHTIWSFKKPPTDATKLKISKRQHGLLFAVLFVISIYTTTVSIGEGTFAKLALVGVLGMGFADSLVLRGIAVLPVRFFSLIVTALAGLIIWPYLLALMAGSFVSGNFVAKHVRKVPDIYMRSVLIAVTIIYLVYLIAK